ncbi:Retrovirus-related Pol polyprotein from transposon 17.6 [Dictyocoela roeselum]|nr:Retrovirus-related Pol polyprotein from transposon 17.6 [Dictyocoela roeselum]
MEEADITKTGFRILNQCFVFKRMPFGLCNSPRTFQENMEIVLETLNYVYVYLDDILIFSKTFEDHLEHLKTIFERLKSHNISINFNKSEFAKQKITFLEHVISTEGIQADISNLHKFKIRKPKNKRELQKILGLLNWFRPYIPNLSLRIHPLCQKVARNNKEFKWSTEDENLFSEIIDQIEKRPLLVHPNFNE